MVVPFWLAFGAGSLLLVPAGVFFTQCCAAAFGRDVPQPELGKRPKLCVMVPAHNEAEGIRATVEGLLPQLVQGDRLLVIADNCSDDTAKVARDAGAEVLERSHDTQRGKGYAISFGLEYLDRDPPEVLLLVDADCSLSEGAIDLLSRLAADTQRPVQAEYLLVAPKDPSVLTSISALAFLVRNRVRPLGMAKLGLPCHMTGSGMAFSWPLIRNTPALGDNLVEDLVMGLDMGLDGAPPLFCPRAKVRSLLPDRKRAASAQRTRWEHGQLSTLVSRGPRLLKESLRQRRPELAGMAADLMVPPLALLVSSLGASTAASALIGALAKRSLLCMLPSAAGLTLVGVGTLTAWSKFARDTVPLKVLLLAPMYVAWKIPMYVSLVVRGRQKTWVRTERTGTEAAPPATTRSGIPSNGSSNGTATARL